MTLVKIPIPLRSRTDGAARVETPGATVAGCLESLERRFPKLSPEIRDESGDLLPSVTLYVNGEDVRYLAGLETPLAEDDQLAIILAIAGGSSALHLVRAVALATFVVGFALSPLPARADGPVAGSLAGAGSYEAAKPASTLGAVPAADPELGRLYTAEEIYGLLVRLARDDPPRAISALGEMLSRPDRHQRKISLKGFLQDHPEAAVGLLRRMDASTLARYFLQDTRNSSPVETLAAFMLEAPEDAASILSPFLISRLAERKEGDRDEFLEEAEKALPWTASLTSNQEKITALCKAFLAGLGKERFGKFLEEGWANAKYTVGYPDAKARLEQALADSGLPPRFYDSSLLDEDLLDPSVLAEAGRTRQPLGQESPWGFYLYSAADNDLEWWEGYRQVRNLEMVGSDPATVQIVAAVDPYSSLGYIRDRVTLAMGRKASNVAGTTDTSRTYYVEQAPLAYADPQGKIYTADPARPVWVWSPAGEKITHSLEAAILSPYGMSPGGYPIVDKQAHEILEWDTVVDQHPGLSEEDLSEVLASPVLEVGERNTGDAEELVRFWKLAREKAPARHTLLVISGHGAGISGIAWDNSSRDPDHLDVEALAGALAEMTDNGRNPIDVLYFQACRMQDLEVARKVAPYVKWIAGFEPISWEGQNAYSLVALSLRRNPDMSAEQVARTLVSARPAPGASMASAIDAAKLLRLDGEVGSFATLLEEALGDPELGPRVVEARVRTPTEEDPDRVDLVAFAWYLDKELAGSAGADANPDSLAGRLLAEARLVATMAREAMPQINVDLKERQGLNGLSIWFPLEGGDWEGTGWVLKQEFFSRLTNPQWGEMVEAAMPLLSPVLLYGPGGERIPGNPRIWRFVDELTLNPLEKGLVALGEKDEGVYELALVSDRVEGFSGAQGGDSQPLEPDRDGLYRVWVKGFDWGSDRPNQIVPVKLIGADGRLVFEQQPQYHTIAVHAAAGVRP